MGLNKKNNPSEQIGQLSQSPSNSLNPSAFSLASIENFFRFQTHQNLLERAGLILVYAHLNGWLLQAFWVQWFHSRNYSQAVPIHQALNHHSLYQRRGMSWATIRIKVQFPVNMNIRQ